MNFYGVIEEKIQKAMREGAFDNLPGKGKPLDLDENPFEDPEWRTAFRMLKTNGFTLPWIEEWQEIERDLEKARKQLELARERCLAPSLWGRPGTGVEANWQQAMAAFREQVIELNRRIQSYNMKAPGMSLQKFPLDAEAEIERVVSVPDGQTDKSEDI